uniref:mitogen-activated protein kinase kinase n=1 Tax=Acrobeloides nanus TaxID=290746 RepID=A0A914C8H2_9BILA
MTEIETLKQLTHPNIVRIHGTFELQDEYVLCMECMEMSLTRFYNVMHDVSGIFLDIFTTAIGYAIINALNFCKAMNIMHRDVKPDNILINREGHIKLGDFGESRILKESLALTFVGTLRYLPPERLTQSEDPEAPYDIRSDVWSLGMTLFECMVGKYPVLGRDGEDITDVMKLPQLIKVELIQQLLNNFIHSKSKDLLTGSQFLFRNYIKAFISQCFSDIKSRPKYKVLVETLFYKNAEMTKEGMTYLMPDCVKCIINNNLEELKQCLIDHLKYFQ